MVSEPPRNPRGCDVGAFAGLPLRTLRCGDLWLVAGAAPEALSESALRAHEAAVRGIAEACEACLPARFGAQAASEEALCAALADRTAELKEALILVRGREQMTVRVQEAQAAREPAPLPESPGARYLEERRRRDALPELDPLREAVRGLVRAERVERHQQLFASVYHLVDKGQSQAYRAAVASVPGLRAAVTGPWPAWSFAPEAL
ncbi:MAG TPA: GvpL/GvpF family gas vesicle protein [Myxococcales bacterium]